MMLQTKQSSWVVRCSAITALAQGVSCAWSRWPIAPEKRTAGIKIEAKRYRSSKRENALYQVTQRRASERVAVCGGGQIGKGQAKGSSNLENSAPNGD